MIPDWLHLLSFAALAAGLISACVIAIDEIAHPQNMWIMNLVWPVVALFGTALTIWGYFKYGRLTTRENTDDARIRHGQDEPSKRAIPFPVMVGKAAAHCGSGCCLGDIAAEWLAFSVPAIAVALGWRTLFAEKMFAVWILDFVFAFGFGIVFQYFTIKPMRNLSVGAGIVQALKADTLSLSAWQIGMYGFMAFAKFGLFGAFLHAQLKVNSVEFWCMMQVAMLAGFITSYPVNWWLLRAGIKEQM
jgi:hypothetical protein